MICISDRIYRNSRGEMDLLNEENEYEDVEHPQNYVPRSVLLNAIRETLEFKSARVLLMSSRLYDVQLASRLVKCEVIEDMSAEVVNHALKEGNEEIIRYLASEECFDFKEHAQDAFIGQLTDRMDTIPAARDTHLEPSSCYAILLWS